MSDAKARHMIYDDKEYTKEPSPLFRAWGDTCAGCAFRYDAEMCRNSCNKDDPATHCCVEGKNYIFKKV